MVIVCSLYSPRLIVTKFHSFVFEPSIFVTLEDGLAGVFVNQIGLYSLFSSDLHGEKVSSIQTLGYYLFVEGSNYNENVASFPKLVAIGLVITAVCIPTVLLARWALKRFGPSED